MDNQLKIKLLKKKIVINSIMLMLCFISFGQWNPNGDNTTSGNVIVQNPQNKEAVSIFSWQNNIARIRIGGNGIGASNGFIFQGVGDSNLLRILNNGNIGIGTLNPQEKLEVKGKIFLNSGPDDDGIYWARHNMTMGTIPGSYNHNNFRLRPGGSSKGKLWSVFQMYTANSESSHAEKIRIHSSGNSFFNGGNVGIGTSTPTKLLDVSGDTGIGKLNARHYLKISSLQWPEIRFETPSSNEKIRIGVAHANNSGYKIGEGDFYVYSQTINAMPFIVNKNGNTTLKSLKINGANPVSSVNGFVNKIELTGSGHGAIVFKPGDAKELMFGFHDNGNFYWGTGKSATKPNYYAMYLNGDEGHLGIRGRLTAGEVKVKLGGWADYVFKENYKLPTLTDVENHIKEKGHLQNIPSASEVEKNGINLGEINVKLLEKIEELTLYTIAQEKQLKQQKETNKALESRLTKIEALLLKK